MVFDARVEGLDAGGLVTTRGFIGARFVVDASGERGARLLGERAVAAREVVSVGHAVHAIGDPAGAAAFLEGIGASPRESVLFPAVYGPGTVVIVTIDGSPVNVVLNKQGGLVGRANRRVSSGQHTVSLVDPAGCTNIPDRIVNCP